MIYIAARSMPVVKTYWEHSRLVVEIGGAWGDGNPMQRDQIIPWEREKVVTTSTKLIQICRLFPKRNIDSYISLAPRQMI
jgi:hypothetical protein